MILYTPRKLAFRFLCWAAFAVAPRVVFKTAYASEAYSSGQWTLKHVPTKVGTPWNVTLSNHFQTISRNFAASAATLYRRAVAVLRSAYTSGRGRSISLSQLAAKFPPLH